MFDYRTNRAVAAEAAFLTVVGSPTKADGAKRPERPPRANEERGSTNRKRHNVYYVWLTPRTKICESNCASREVATPQAEAQRSEQKREVAFDNLEVGDHVEIQFARERRFGLDRLCSPDRADAQETRAPPHACRIRDRDHDPAGQGRAVA